jgi:hypothetical protein
MSGALFGPVRAADTLENSGAIHYSLKDKLSIVNSVNVRDSSRLTEQTLTRLKFLSGVATMCEY